MVRYVVDADIAGATGCHNDIGIGTEWIIDGIISDDAGGGFTNGINLSGSTIGTADYIGHEGEIIFNDPDGTWDFGAANLTTTTDVTGDTAFFDIYTND